MLCTCRLIHGIDKYFSFNMWLPGFKFMHRLDYLSSCFTYLYDRYVTSCAVNYRDEYSRLLI